MFRVDRPSSMGGSRRACDFPASKRSARTSAVDRRVGWGKSTGIRRYNRVAAGRRTPITVAVCSRLAPATAGSSTPWAARTAWASVVWVADSCARSTSGTSMCHDGAMR